MFAVIRTGGKQYRVTEGDKIRIEKIDTAAGEVYEFNDVLLVSKDDKVTVGSPTIAGSKVTADVLSHGRGKKVNIVKFRRRKHYMKRMGHRQSYTEVQVKMITS